MASTTKALTVSSIVMLLLYIASLALSIASFAHPAWTQFNIGGNYTDYNPYTTASINTAYGSSNATFASLILWIELFFKVSATLMCIAIGFRIHGVSDKTLSASDVIHAKMKLLGIVVLEIATVVYINNNVDYPGHALYGVNFTSHTKPGFILWTVSVACAALPALLVLLSSIVSQTMQDFLTTKTYSTNGKKRH